MAGKNPADISRRNPSDEYDLIQRVGSGTYGDVYKVIIAILIALFAVTVSTNCSIIHLFETQVIIESILQIH